MSKMRYAFRGNELVQIRSERPVPGGGKAVSTYKPGGQVSHQILDSTGAERVRLGGLA